MDDVRSVPQNALTCGGRSRDEVADPPQTPDPEPIGPLAEQFLDRLAAQPVDEDLAARRRAALDRLRRQKPAIRTRKES